MEVSSLFMLIHEHALWQWSDISIVQELLIHVDCNMYSACVSKCGSEQKLTSALHLICWDYLCAYSKHNCGFHGIVHIA